VQFAGRDDVAFALEGCTGWRYVAGELAGSGVAAHVAEPPGTAFARGRKRHAKTDKTDSRHLRELLAEGRQHKPPLRQPGRAVDITARIERRSVVSGLISEYRRAA